METQTIGKEIDKLLDDLWQEVHDIDQQLKSLPRGYLYESTSHGEPQYHWKTNPGDDRRMYLSKITEAELICQLAERRYLELLRKTDLNNIELLEKEKRLLTKYHPREDVFELLPPGMKQRVHPKAVSKETYAKEWLNQIHGENYRDEHRKLRTRRGEWVRSKSEVIIADMLFSYGIPYKYEEPFWSGDRTLFPDFTILNTRTREEIIWEHLGELDSKDYADKNCRKIERYSRAGYQIGNRFLCTMETYDSPLSTEVARNLIQTHFQDQFSTDIYEGWTTYDEE